MEFLKVEGTSRPADLMTKHLAREQFEQYVETLNLDCREGHAATAVKLHSTQQKHWEIHKKRGSEPVTDDDNDDDDDDEHYDDGPAESEA